MLLKVPIVIRQNYKAYYVQIHINPKQKNTARFPLMHRYSIKDYILYTAN